MNTSDISRIQILQNQDTRESFNKMTFRKGESVTARILNINKGSDEVIVRLLDGRQFPARIDNSIEGSLVDNQLLKFVVSDIKDGKLILMLKNDSENSGKGELPTSQKDVLLQIAKNLGLNVSKGDESIIKEMLDFNIALTQENIDEVKNLLEFKERINTNPKEEQKFIDKYLSAKNIPLDSEQGNKIENTLKKFFSELKTMDSKTIFMLKEENIPLTKENIESFSKLNNGETNIFKDVKDIESLIKKLDVNNKEINSENSVNKLEQNNKAKENVQIEGNEKKAQNQEVKTEENINTKEILKENGKEIKDKFKAPLDEVVKNQIKEKTTNLKESIQTLIKASKENPETFAKAMQFMEGKMQDFKMFNTLSNDYYFLNVPMNIEKQEYDCKLVIKDERGKGKKLDSTNMKIATSITTINMGVVDAYVSVNNYYIDINIESNKEFMDIIELYKDDLIKDLNLNSYSFNVQVNEKMEEFNMSNCREFFNDKNLGMLDVMV
ncbi:hypothetical protein [Clostridium ihumii]|uniref:hypothetical protein n=1 Tax=Clostridium ihumii TaxID=1470356 RepID=UPI000550BAA5|nr:hypothetical protein [Clostridium ihumii]